MRKALFLLMFACGGIIIDPPPEKKPTPIPTPPPTPPRPFCEVERCNGVDDDCDGTIDGPSADAWCTQKLANSQSAACIAGSCQVVDCIGDYADCNGVPIDGCEAKLVARYEDWDGDGHGAGGLGLVCEGDPLYTTTHDDCYDSNADAYPGQTKYFTIDRGDGSFDYNCDAKDDPEYANVHGDYCVCSTTCSTSAGWMSSVPSCGDVGTYRQKDKNPSTCDEEDVTRTQSCR